MYFLAIKHLLARKKQSFVTLMGVFIGTCGFIVISAFFGAMQDSITSSVVSGDAHVKFSTREDEITQSEIEDIFYKPQDSIKWIKTPSGLRTSDYLNAPYYWIQKLKEDKEVVAVTPVLTSTVIVNSEKNSYSVNVVGIDPVQQMKVTNIEDNMTSGSLLDLNKGIGRVIIGEQLANLISKTIGDNVNFVSAKGQIVPFKIVGTFATGARFSDRGTAYALLSDVQKLNGSPGQVSQLSVKVKDYKQASAKASEWRTYSSDRILSWDEQNENLMSMFKSQDITRFTVTGIIMLVAGFGIYNILNMVVMQKRKEIAILRSMGFESDDVIRLFLIQGLILGLLGGIFGVLIGYLICYGIGDISMGGPRSMKFKLEFDSITALTSLVISNGVALAASYFPAYGAGKLTPIEIIRAGAE